MTHTYDTNRCIWLLLYRHCCDKELKSKPEHETYKVATRKLIACVPFGKKTAGEVSSKILVAL